MFYDNKTHLAVFDINKCYPKLMETKQFFPDSYDVRRIDLYRVELSGLVHK